MSALQSYDFGKFRRAVVMGYSIRFLWGLYRAIKHRQFKGCTSSFASFVSKMRDIFLSIDHYRFAVTFFNVASTYHVLQGIYDRYIARKERKMDTKITADYIKQKRRNKIGSNVIFSVLSCFWFKRLPKKFRHIIVLHLLVRSGYDLIKLLKYDEHYGGKLPQIPYDDIWILSIILALIASTMCHCPSIIDKGYYKFLLKWGNNTPEQLKTMFQTPSTFTACSPTWHQDPSCLRHYTKGFFIDTIKSSRMYAIVHLIPLLIQIRFYKLIFRFITSFIKSDDGSKDEDDQDKDKNKQSRKELMTLIIKKLTAILRSSMFFAGMQHFGKVLMCWMRYYVLKSDPIYNAAGCVIVGSSIAQLFETSNRRIQYSLYLFPEILKMASNALHFRYGAIGFKKIYEWWDIVAIQISFAIWSYLVSVRKSDQICSKFTSSLVLNTFL